MKIFLYTANFPDYLNKVMKKCLRNFFAQLETMQKEEFKEI